MRAFSTSEFPIGLSQPYSWRLPLPGREHRAHPFDSTFPRFACFRGVDPVDEVPARVRRQAAPSGLRRRCRLESVVQIERHDRVTARPSLSGYQHVARPFDPTSPRLRLFGGGDPAQEVSARDRRQVAPSDLRPGCRREGFAQIRRHGELGHCM
jgi:hypothetical protein